MLMNVNGKFVTTGVDTNKGYTSTTKGYSSHLADFFIGGLPHNGTVFGFFLDLPGP